MKNIIKYEAVKDITKALKKSFRKMQVNSYGHCCWSDYDMYHKYINEDDYVCCKLFKGGMNNDYNYNEKEFEIGDTLHYMWCLTEFNLDEVIEVMQGVASQYNAEVIKPKDYSECIKLKFKG